MDQIPFMVNNRSKIPFINLMQIYALWKNNKVWNRIHFFKSQVIASITVDVFAVL